MKNFKLKIFHVTIIIIINAFIFYFFGNLIRTWERESQRQSLTIDRKIEHAKRRKDQEKADIELRAARNSNRMKELKNISDNIDFINNKIMHSNNKEISKKLKRNVRELKIKSEEIRKNIILDE